MESYPGSDAWWLRHTIRITLQYKNLVGHIAYYHYSNMCGLDALKLEPSDLADQELLGDLAENDCAFGFDENTDTFSFMLQTPNGKINWDFDASIDELGCYIIGLEIIDVTEYDPNTGEVVAK